MLDIIVADDDAGVVQSLKSRLETAGHSVRTAGNGREALEAVAQQAPDLVITDIIMPEREGIETIVELQRLHPAIKILAISGGGRSGRVSYLCAASDLGADGVLAKPFTSRQLLDAIAALGLQSGSEEL